MIVRLVSILIAVLIMGAVGTGLYLHEARAPAASAVSAKVTTATDDGAGAAGSAGSSAPDDEPDAVLTRAIPMDEERLALSDVIVQLYDVLGHEAPASLRDVMYTVNTGSFLGRAQLAVIGPLTRGAIDLDLREHDALLTVDRDRVAQAMEEMNGTERQWLDRFAVVLTEQFGGGRRFGTRFISERGDAVPIGDALDAEGRLPERIVLLVHGLDDPGWLWRDAIPALRGAGYSVARFDYPNDGPIADSADFLARELGRLRESGVQHVDVIAHSMGGLVTRDVLTRAAYYDGDGSGDDERPAIDRLIMLGTPNGGSEWARIRTLSEIKEQVSRALRHDGSLLGSLGDGEGEAGEDLLPGSPYLDDLNARANATHTRYTIVAGRVSPVSEGDVDMITSAARMLADTAHPPAWLQARLRATERSADHLFGELVRGVGDGCVTLDSAHLDGVDDVVVVEANHVSMIAEIVPLPGRQPPAIDVILNRLARDD